MACCRLTPAVSPRQRPHPGDKSGQRLRRNPTPQLGFAGEAEAQEYARLATALLAVLTFSFRRPVKNRSTLAITRSPFRWLCT